MEISKVQVNSMIVITFGFCFILLDSQLTKNQECLIVYCVFLKDLHGHQKNLSIKKFKRFEFFPYNNNKKVPTQLVAIHNIKWINSLIT